MAVERWSPQGKSHRQLIRAVKVVRYAEGEAACTMETALFTEIEFRSKGVTDEERTRASHICDSCQIVRACPVRVIPAQRKRRGSRSAAA